MVEPIPLHRHAPVLPAGTVERWSEQDALDLALAEHFETVAEELRRIVAGRELLRRLFDPQAVAS